MNEVNFLQNVIRQVEKSEAIARAKANSDTEKVIVLDKRTREVQARIPTISLGGNLLYYIVSNDSSSLSLARDLQIEIEDFFNDRKLGISITYRVSCYANNEEKLAKALCNDISLESELDKRINRWMRELTQDNVVNFIDNYDTEAKKLYPFLKEKAKNELGLRLELRIALVQTQDSHHSIFNNRDNSTIAQRKGLIVEIEDVHSGRKLSIVLDYRADIIDREKVTQKLSAGKQIREEVEHKIRYWINSYTRGKELIFIDKYVEQEKELHKFLQTSAQQEIGLKLDLSITLEKQVETIQIPASEITVRLSDSDEALDLTIQTELLVVDRVKAISYLTKWGTLQLTNLVRAEIKNYLQNCTTINEFYYELKDKVRNRLVEHLNQRLNDKGRKITYLYLDSKAISSSPPPKELIEIRHTVRCIVQNYSGLIPVENTLQMSRQDMSRYISAQSPNLQAWVENSLEKIVKPLLLSKRYIDILTSFQIENEKIRKQMREEAESIGYKVQHIVSIPRLEHLDLKADFEIVDENQQFSSNVASIEVKLSTTVNAKFENFDKVEHFLNSSVGEIIEEMRKVVHNKTKEILRKTQPERFYMHFFVPEEGQISVEEELKAKITEVLKERFGVTILSVVPINKQTPILEYVERLLGMPPGTFECEILSLDQSELIKLDGEFKIEGIRPGQWHRFQSGFLSRQQSHESLRKEYEALKTDYDNLISLGDVQVNKVNIEKMSQRISTIENDIFGIQKIRKCIEESIRTQLSLRYESSRLIYTFLTDKDRLDKEMGKWASDSVAEQYGLEVSLRHINRSQTEEEKQKKEQWKKQLDVNHEIRLKQLEEKRKQFEMKLEATTKKVASQIETGLNIFKDRNTQLQEYYERRRQLQLAGDKYSQQELKVLEAAIVSIESEVIDASLEDEADEPININLIKSQPSQTTSLLESKEHSNNSKDKIDQLKGNPSNPKIKESVDLDSYSKDDEDYWGNL